ncbi:MAG TPA: hypothetical protein VEJ84_17140 [Acidimicrobiales bacterium]|nr:hypothetical protein [Acidimicrobiales bacterium]
MELVETRTVTDDVGPRASFMQTSSVRSMLSPNPDSHLVNVFSGQEVRP